MIKEKINIKRINNYYKIGYDSTNKKVNCPIEQMHKIIAGVINERIVKVQRNNSNLFIFYDDCILTLEDYHHIVKNDYYFKSLIDKALGIYYGDLKVQRKAKNIGIKISSALVAGAIAISAYNFFHKSDDININIPDTSIESTTNEIPFEDTNTVDVQIIDESIDDTDELIENNDEYFEEEIDNQNNDSDNNLIENENNCHSDYTSAAINVEYGANAFTDRNITAREYFESIKAVANEFNIDEELMLAIATQEKGFHSPTPDSGGAVGIMQIQCNVYKDGYGFYVYKNNNENITREKFTFYYNEYTTILGNLRAGAAILQYCMNHYNGNVICAVAAYNMGTGTVDRSINSYCNDYGTNYDAVLSDLSNIKWLDYLPTNMGDRNYFYKVMSWLNTDKIKTCWYELDSDKNILEHVTNYELNNLDLTKKGR